MLTTLLCIIGVIVIAKFAFTVLFPVTAFRVRALLLARTLVKVLEKEAKRNQQ